VRNFAGWEGFDGYARNAMFKILGEDKVSFCWLARTCYGTGGVPALYARSAFVRCRNAMFKILGEDKVGERRIIRKCFLI
jgi:hypothetical protein